MIYDSSLKSHATFLLSISTSIFWPQKESSFGCEHSPIGPPEVQAVLEDFHGIDHSLLAAGALLEAVAFVETDSTL